MSLQHIEHPDAATQNAAAPAGVPGSPYTARRHVPVDHASFAGHFPSNPLLPGVVLVSETMETIAGFPELAAAIGPKPALDWVKFLAPVRPGSTLCIELKLEPKAVLFEVRCGDVVTAKGRFMREATQ